ncbi:hypothetical protein RSAG8_06255, partial [Rhizoctonia solani AG-8 WAC10335]
MSSSSGRVRSKNGCITCKKRRKKCDEARPICERCAKAGMQCLGYESTNSDSRPVRIRPRGTTRVTSSNSRNSSIPRPSSSTPAITSPSDSISGSQSHEFARPRLPLPHYDGLAPSAEGHTQAVSEHSQTETPVASDVFDFSFMSPPLSGFSFSPQFGGDPSTWDANLLQNHLEPWIPGQQSEGAGSLSLSPQATAQPATPNLSDGQQTSLALYKPPHSPDTSKRMTSGQASLLNALFSLGQPTSDRITPTSSGSYSTPSSTNGSTWPSPDTEQDQESETSEDSDPEGVRQIVCGTPTLEPTVQSNSLPFVLFSYATMATRTMYEPLKMAGILRDWITERFNYSDESRTGITTLATIFHTMWNTRTSAADYIPMATRIATQLRQKLVQTSSSLGLAAQNEAQRTRTLSEALEIINLQIHAGSLRAKLEMMAETAPLFRSACPEAPHELIDLPALMRVLDRTKPSRTPDVFLLAPLNIVGRVTSHPREREIIRQRLLNLQECSHPGTCAHDSVRILENVWARSDAEGRLAVWSDARIATLAVCGI